jgi:hypothetical protein
VTRLPRLCQPTSPAHIFLRLAPAVAVTLTPEAGRMFASGNAVATVTAAGPVADSGIDIDNPAAATMSADDAASSMLEKGKHTIKTEPRILVFRCNTRYYNSVWAVD